MDITMSRIVRAALISLVTIVPAAVNVQAQEANREQKASAAPDFKVAVWYDLRRPVETFRFQTYDVRKGQYTPAVEEWLDLMTRRYPNYLAYVKPIRLRKDGGTEAEQVAAAIDRERIVAAGFVIGPRPSAVAPFIETGTRPRGWGTAAPARIGGSPVRSFSAPGSGGLRPISPSNPSPFPVPYPRPHP